MDEFNESEAVSASEAGYTEEYEAPEVLDTWDLDDFEDLLDCMRP